MRASLKVVDESVSYWNSQFCAVGGNLVYHVHCDGENGEAECSVHTAESLRRELPKITKFGKYFSRGVPANIAANAKYLVATDARKSRVWRWEIAVAWRAGIATSFSQTRLAALTDEVSTRGASINNSLYRGLMVLWQASLSKTLRQNV